MPHQKLSVKEIFDEAAEIASPEERIAWLDEVCAKDPDLRTRVDDLLQAHEQAGSFLEPVVAPTVTTPPIREGPGTQIGPYKLREQIGEGGFGIVFLAEQTEPVRRRVALKIIKPGMDTREVIARFEAERQALALMDHPNIAKVLDAGTTGGVKGQESRAKDRPLLDPQPSTLDPAARPYFVMELVKGIPITEYCDQSHLQTRDRLELFVQACQAIQHAHQKGIIHRDIKPSNVLIAMQDGRPVPKVIDFGVAKAINQRLTEQTLLTKFAQMVGTPLYMSPEQAEMSALDVDTRSDIYSLGVLLYELLTGTTPFTRERLKEATYDELRRIIREEEPARPSARISTLGADAETIAEKRRTDPRRLRQTVRGDLDWIVMRALEKDRMRRYENANALSNDVLRYLKDQPVEACPPSPAYRLKKFVRRNRATVATTVGVMTTVVIAASLGYVAHRRGIAAAAAERRREAAEKQAQIAAIVAENARLDALVEEGLRLSSGWQPDFARAIENFTTVLDQRPGDERVRLLRGSTYQRSGEPGKAISDLERALALQPEDNLAAQALLALALQETGQEEEAARHLALAQQQNPDHVEALVTQALALRYDERALELMNRAFEQRPLDPTLHYYRGLVAGNLALELGRVEHYELAIKDLEKAVKTRPNEWRFRDRLVSNLIHMQAFRASHDAAFSRAKALIDDWLTRHPDDPGALAHLMAYRWVTKTDLPETIELGLKLRKEVPRKASVCWFLAHLYDHRGDYEQAIKWWDESLRIRPHVGPVYAYRAMTRIRSGDLEGARADIASAEETPVRQRTDWNWWTLCEAYRMLDDHESCLRICEDWIDLAPESARAHHYLGQAYSGLGQNQCDLKRYEDAVSAFKKAFELNADPSDLWRCAEVYEKLGRPEDAGAAFEQYVDLLTNGVNGNSDDWKSMQRRTVAYHRFAGRAWNAYLSGRWQHAIDYYTWAFELAPGRTDRMRANQLLVRGIAHTKLEHWDEAMDDFRATCQLDPQPRRYSWLAIALIGKRDFARARDALEDALDIKEPSPDNLKIGRHSLYNRTAWLLATCADEQVRDPKQAVEYAERAVELVPGHAPVREGAYRNTLGVACYRAGDFQRAIDELEQSCELFVHRNNAFNTFFLAMAHWQLGNPEKAREYYAEAVAWMDEHAKDNEELLRFRAEAQALPGLEGERSEIGEQVTRD